MNVAVGDGIFEVRSAWFVNYVEDYVDFCVYLRFLL